MAHTYGASFSQPCEKDWECVPNLGTGPLDSGKGWNEAR